MEDEFMRIELADNGWRKHFELLTEKSRPFKSDVAEHEANRPLNRYLDVKPYDKSRIKISRSDDTDYINANLVTVPKANRQYILTQGPLEDTRGHFWAMVWEQRSSVIIMLNQLVECGGIVKCERYWPRKVAEVDRYPEVDLEVKLKSATSQKHFILRELEVKEISTDKTRKVLQFHYTGWPDYDQPDSPTSFLKLLTAVRKSGGFDRMDEPAIVHCSAGIGRSGTFCLIDSVLSMIENQGSTEGIDILTTLVEMRDYRMGLIQSDVQLRFAYMSIVLGIKILERAGKLQPHMTLTTKETLSLETNGQAQKANGSSQGRRNRNRNKRKSSNTNSQNTLNIFKKDYLVESFDDVDSDTADSIFYDAMKPLPSFKKPRSEVVTSEREPFTNNRSPVKTFTNINDLDVDTFSSKARLLTTVMNSLLTEKSISATISNSNKNGTSNNATESSNSSNNIDANNDKESNQNRINDSSVLFRRMERELKNQKIAERVRDIKAKMDAAELSRQKYSRTMSFIKRGAIYGGVAALVLSSVIYFYNHGNP